MRNAEFHKPTGCVPWVPWVRANFVITHFSRITCRFSPGDVSSNERVIAPDQESLFASGASAGSGQPRLIPLPPEKISMHAGQCIRGFRGLVCLAALAAVAAPAMAQDAFKPDPLDWPHWRGPEMNSVSREKGLVSSWSPDGENLIWKSTDLATRSTPIVMNGKLYVLCRHNPETTTEGEKVVCVNAAT